MKKFKRTIIFAIFTILVIVIAQINLRPSKTDQIVRKRDGLKRVLQNAKSIHRIWEEGEDSREWLQVKDQCLKKRGVTAKFDESLLRCRPLLLECINEFMPSKEFQWEFLGFSYPHYEIKIEDKTTHEQLIIGLEDRCREIYLEQNIYSYGEPPKNISVEDYQFDTFNRNLYFDQFLATNDEVNEWLIETGNKGRVVSDGNKLFLPAVNLSLTEMQNFCSYKGKQLMLAHIFDAATFLTQDRIRSPYYWTKNKSEPKISCENIFSSECAVETKWKINYNSPSWAGMTDSMGGVTEVFRNPVDTESNLKASSIYFSRNSPWHRLGFRAHWNGEGSSVRHFNFKGIEPEVPIDNLSVGFRCMREETI